MPTRECNGASPGGWKTVDGRLWFPTMKGLAAIDPNGRNAVPPRVALERLTVDGVFPKDVQINVYRAVQESVNNVLRHSNATAAAVSVRRSASQLQIVIEDDGAGFAVDAETAGAAGGGFGLVGITERVRLIGGRAQFDSAPGRGTRVSLIFDRQGIRGGW